MVDSCWLTAASISESVRLSKESAIRRRSQGKMARISGIANILTIGQISANEMSGKPIAL